jgi:hypothetical protein
MAEKINKDALYRAAKPKEKDVMRDQVPFDSAKLFV